MNITSIEVWSNSKLEVMEDILSSRLFSDESFKLTLQETKYSNIVEYTNYKFWGSGFKYLFVKNYQTIARFKQYWLYSNEIPY